MQISSVCTKPYGVPKSEARPKDKTPYPKNSALLLPFKAASSMYNLLRYWDLCPQQRPNQQLLQAPSVSLRLKMLGNIGNFLVHTAFESCD